MVKIIYRAVRKKINSFFSINWFSTFYINFKLLPFQKAKHLPLIVFRGYKVRIYGGKIKFNVPIKFGMIGFGQAYEIFIAKTNNGEAVINGTIVFNGSVQFGIDTKLFVGQDATLTFGHLNSFARQTQIICFNNIFFGDYVRFGGECVIVDTNFHNLKNIETQEILPQNGSISVGNYNYIGIRTIMRMGTITPNNCIIASNSLCNKDYTHYGEQIILAGMPINKCKRNIVRDWENELESLQNYLKIRIL